MPSPGDTATPDIPRAVLRQTIQETLGALDVVLAVGQAEFISREVGRVVSVGQGVARVRGLPGVRSEELISLHGGLLGLAYNLDPDEVGVVLLGNSQHLAAGSLAHRTGRILDVPVGDGLVGRVMDALGRPLDDLGPLRSITRLPVERPAPPIVSRAAIIQPLQTEIKVIDSLLPIGRGQRELILGDRQTGKTAVALDAILKQRDKNVLCVYCAIGQRSSAVAKFLAVLRQHDALRYCVVVVAAGDEPPGVQFVAPTRRPRWPSSSWSKGRMY